MEEFIWHVPRLGKASRAVHHVVESCNDSIWNDAKLELCKADFPGLLGQLLQRRATIRTCDPGKAPSLNPTNSQGFRTLISGRISKQHCRLSASSAEIVALIPEATVFGTGRSYLYEGLTFHHYLGGDACMIRSENSRMNLSPSTTAG
jgi:hypothetical protein